MDEKVTWPINSKDLAIELDKFRASFIKEAKKLFTMHNIKFTKKMVDVEILELYKNTKILKRKHINAKISDRLGQMFYLISENIANKSNFKGYTYIEDMKSQGYEFLCCYAYNFNKDKGNAFAYVTQICKSGFIQYLKKENKQSTIKNEIIKKSMRDNILDSHKLSLQKDIISEYNQYLKDNVYDI
jgi:hypothetical protein